MEIYHNWVDDIQYTLISCTSCGETNYFHHYIDSLKNNLKSTHEEYSTALSWLLYAIATVSSSPRSLHLYDILSTAAASKEWNRQHLPLSVGTMKIKTLPPNMTVAATLRALGINLWMSTTDVRRCYHPSCVVILLMTAADKSLLRGFADLKSALSAICRLEVGVVGRLSADCRQNCRLEVGIWRRPEAYSVIFGGIGIFLLELPWKNWARGLGGALRAQKKSITGAEPNVCISLK